MTHTMRIALLVLCASVYLLTAPGRIVFSDDEIVFQTTRALAEHGSLAIEGIPRRAGEPRGRPDGTFGWAPGLDGERYGFFGHGLSVAAMPLYATGKAAAAYAPETWRHAIRSDTHFLHRRTPVADWTRMFVSFTNCIVTALAAVVLAQWLTALGYGAAIAVAVALSYALGTSAWAYAGTFLSEPLSGLVLLTAGFAVTRFFGGLRGEPQRANRWLWIAAALVGLSGHVHLLNVTAIPAFLVWVGVGLRRDGAWSRQRTAVAIAIGLGAAGLASLGWLNAARFGSVFETGRYDHYSHFTAPFEGLAAMVIAPGRSLWLYSPALLLALPGVRMFARRHRDVAIFVAVLFACRWIFVAARSDWWGGWAVGPRYLIALLPVMMLPAAEVFTRAARAPRGTKVALAVAIAGCVALALHLALYSVFEHMAHVAVTYGRDEYLDRSHWAPSASPWVGFGRLPLDTLAKGTWTLAKHGHTGFLWVMSAVAVLAMLSGVALLRAVLPRTAQQC